MKRFFLIVLIIIIFVGCERVFTPDIKNTNSSLVVEGLISTNPGQNMISVSSTAPFNNYPNIKRLTGLEVYVLDNLGYRIDFEDNDSSGLYVTNNDSLSIGKIGNSYTLFINSPSGDIYKSSPQLLNKCPVIDSIYIEPDKESFLTQDAYGNAVEITNDGINILNDTKGILPEKNYYLFRWYGFIEQHIIIRGLTETFNYYDYNPISPTYLNILCTGDADEYNDKILRKNKFVFLPENEYLTYKPDLPVGYKVISCSLHGLVLASVQFSLCEDAYKFWKQAENQLSASNKIFDPVSTQVKGNLTCISNPDKLIYGVFFASDRKTRFDYLYVAHKRFTYSRELDSLPNISPGENPPPNWIFPPTIIL